MDLKELKIVLDWAKANLERDKGARVAFPEQFEQNSKIYQKVRDMFDAECKWWIERHIGKI